MVHLRLTGVSEDGRKLLLGSDAGVEFTVDVDDRLRAALRGDQARLAQLEMQMDSTLRPRDIQARIRAGETPESVAQVAGTSVDKVMPYAAPVLAEREHVARRAQRASIRRRPTETTSTGSSARTLGDAVGGHLRGRNVDPDTVSWDAWRREDGRWTLTGSYTTTDRVGAAHFSFDGPGNYVVADDDDAHWLLGEVADVPVEAAAAPDDLTSARRRRLSAVPPDELPLGEDALELVSDDPPPAARVQVDADAPEAGVAGAESVGDESAGDESAGDEWAGDESISDESARDEVALDTVATGADAPDAATDPDPHSDEPPSRKPVKKTRGRASVPSWDEIMFGGSSSPE